MVIEKEKPFLTKKKRIFLIIISILSAFLIYYFFGYDRRLDTFFFGIALIFNMLTLKDVTRKEGAFKDVKIPLWLLKVILIILFLNFIGSFGNFK